MVKDCYKRNILTKEILHGENLNNILGMDLVPLVSFLGRKNIKILIKDFSKNGDKEKLLIIRKALVKETSEKLIFVLNEGLLNNPKDIKRKLKYMFQFRHEEKIFGLSSKNFNYVGSIRKSRDIDISVENVYTDEPKLTERTTGLQINIYTDIKISSPSHSEELTVQNQLRYKHRTFTCAPEANFHLLKYEDWRKLYP